MFDQLVEELGHPQENIEAFNRALDEAENFWVGDRIDQLYKEMWESANHDFAKMWEALNG